jgi:hypothetical protein
MEMDIAPGGDIDQVIVKDKGAQLGLEKHAAFQCADLEQ